MRIYRPAMLALIVCACSLTASSLLAGTYDGGTGTSNDPYRIADANDLLELAATTADYGKSFVLTADIDLAGRVFTTAIIAPDTVANNSTFEGTAFTGTFDGNDHKVFHFSINGGSNDYLGLFGEIWVGSVIKNLGIEDFTSSFTSGSFYVGGLVGYNLGIIRQCYSTGTVGGGSYDSWRVGGLAGGSQGGIINCHSTGTVSGGGAVGGLVGANYGGIMQCYSVSTTSSTFPGNSPYVGGLVGSSFSSINQCYSTGTVSTLVGSHYVGGLAGYTGDNSSTRNCYSTCTVSGSSYMGGLVGRHIYGPISQCYSTGAVSGTGTNIGGLVGYRQVGTISGSFWDTDTSGQPASVEGIGKSTTEMKDPNTFLSAGWDFTNESANGTNDIWRMCEGGVDYPKLNWESVGGDFACPDGVNVEDLSYLAQRWLSSGCAASNNCGGTDMDVSGSVDFADFALMAANWLKFDNATTAIAAAQAGYDSAIIWMGVPADILGEMAANPSLFSDTFSIGDSTATWTVTFENYVGARPIFRVLSIGTCQSTKYVIDRLVMQEIGGWEMAKCRIPASTTTDVPVYFSTAETVSIPIHINKLNDSPDVKDIYIAGTPAFLQKVSMGESRNAGEVDKYDGVMSLFEGGIAFNEPNVKIADETAVVAKLDRFRTSTKAAYTFTPVASANISVLPSYVTAHPAVQIEMYTDADTGEGMLRITNNCTVIGSKRVTPGSTWDYKVVPGSAGDSFTTYDVYAYHYRWDPTDAATPAGCKPFTVPVTDTYVSQTFGGKPSEPGGQIFVYGDVVLGSDVYDMVLAGKLTIVAQRSGTNTDDGHIWIADSIVVDGERDLNGMPVSYNPNALGLVAGGVVKVIDPGMSGYPQDIRNRYPGPPPGPSPYYLNTNSSTAKQVYVPVADIASGSVYAFNRWLPDPMVIEAAITVGGGGFGAENVAVIGSSSYGGRREYGESLSHGSETLMDQLVLRGSICEVTRGVVGIVGRDGYLKHYYMDERLLDGILPGNIWFGGKYVPAK